MSYWRSGLLKNHSGRSLAARSRDLTSVSIIVIGAVLAIFVILGTLALHRGDSGGDDLRWNAPQQALPPQDPQAPVPVPVRPPPSESPSPAPSTSPAPVSKAPTSNRPDRPAPAKPSPVGNQPRPLIPAAGSRINLVAEGAPGLRLRHRDFRVGLEMVGPRSSPLDRSDSTFVVRAGLGNSRCLSLEAVNYPGRFVRHQDFRLYLHPRERSALFAADATFCAQATGSGGAFVLRAVNYPDRFLASGRSGLRLSRVPAGNAQVFRATAAP